MPRWTDDRLDDLHQLVTTLDGKVDANTSLLGSHDRDLKEISRSGDRRRDTNRGVYLVGFTVIATSLANLILHLAHLA